MSELSQYIDMESFELFFRLSIIQLQHLVMTEDSPTNADIYTYFLLLDEYLDLFINDQTSKNQVLLKKVTNDILERLESQITALVAVLSGVLQFSKSNDTILATCKFLSNWLQCEMRAITSHAIAENLINLCLFTKEKNSLIYGAFLSGFYKATDSEDGASTYFEKTELVRICRNNMAQQLDEHIHDISGNILLEYLIYLEKYDKRNDTKYNWTTFSSIVMKSNAQIHVKTALVLKNMIFSEKCFNANALFEVINYLQGAFTGDTVNLAYVDPDIPGTDQVWHIHDI